MIISFHICVRISGFKTKNSKTCTVWLQALATYATEMSPLTIITEQPQVQRDGSRTVNTFWRADFARTQGGCSLQEESLLYSPSWKHVTSRDTDHWSTDTQTRIHVHTLILLQQIHVQFYIICLAFSVRIALDVSASLFMSKNCHIFSLKIILYM